MASFSVARILLITVGSAAAAIGACTLPTSGSLEPGSFFQSSGDLGIFWAGTCTIQFIGAQGGCPANQACDNSNPQKCVAGAAIGAPCPGGNSDCVSGLCSSGLCIVRQQNFGWPCRDQNDCDNGGCQANHFCG